MLKKYKSFLENKKIDIGLPQEVIDSTLIISRSMYESVKKHIFFEENNDFFIKFQVTPMDFKYIDPNEVLPLDLSVKAMGKRNFYVELQYDDQIPSTNEVVYKIIFDKMTSDKYKKEKDDDFIDEYEEELKRQIDEDNEDLKDFEF